MSQPIPACGNTRSECPGPPGTLPEHPSNTDYRSEKNHAIDCGTCQAAMMNCARNGCRLALDAFAPWLLAHGAKIVSKTIPDWEDAIQDGVISIHRAIQGEGENSLSPAGSLDDPEQVPKYASTTFKSKINNHIRARDRRRTVPSDLPPGTRFDPDVDPPRRSTYFVPPIRATDEHALARHTFDAIVASIRDYEEQITRKGKSRYTTGDRRLFFELWLSQVLNPDFVGEQRKAESSYTLAARFRKLTGLENFSNKTADRWIKEYSKVLRSTLWSIVSELADEGDPQSVSRAAEPLHRLLEHLEPDETTDQDGEDDV